MEGGTPVALSFCEMASTTREQTNQGQSVGLPPAACIHGATAVTTKTNDRVMRTFGGGLLASGLRSVVIAATPVTLFLFLMIVVAPAPAAANPNDPENKAATKCP